MAAAVAALFGLSGTHALALSLGRITVQSALGESLRAEIDILDINAEEAASLKTSVAPPEAFRSAGLEYNAAMAGVQITLQRRPDGRAYIRVSSERTINEPFVDMILEASWSSGRIVRDYTMLFDPPNLRQPAAPAPTLPQTAAIPAPAQTPAPATSASTSPPRPAPVPRSTPAPAPAPADSAASKARDEGGKRVTVKSGDTASKIAVANKPAGVSLDQMLVALLRANPEAFIGDNINRIKTGAVVSLPGADQALATPAPEASQIVIAQSKDFNEYRRKLASSAPSAQVAAADRKARGTVQATVEEKKPAATAPDKLTLSKGAVQGKPGEDKIAKDRAAQDAASRTAELSKNISELSKLGAASGVAAPAAPAAAAASAPAPVSTPAVAAATPAASAPAPLLAASAAAATSSAPKTAASAPAKRPVAAPPVVAAPPGLVDELMENPLVPAGAGGLIALLVALGIYRSRQRKKAAQDDSSFLASRLQPDSFFDASGGQRVDTSDGVVSGSSMVYSPSQLDAADDVDPVAEADVYLAYGRDLQAEEILKEALRTNPGRIAIHQKLLEIYAKRRDLKGFENTANEAYRLTDGKGPEWERVCELGLTVDPTNALYQPGGQPASLAGPASAAATESPDTFASSTMPPEIEEPAPAPAASPIDLDLDFSLDDEPAKATASTPPSFALDLDLATEAMKNTPAAEPEPLDFALPELALETDDLSPASGKTPAPPAAAPADSGMLEFDLGSLSLDLDTPAQAPATIDTPSSEDPLVTKLALAEEFGAIGDMDGARALIEEVIGEASGDVKARAQAALNKLN